MTTTTPLSLYLEFNWQVKGDFSQFQLDCLSQVGLDLREFADRCTAGQGTGWLLQNLSPLRFHLRGLNQRLASWVNRQPTSIVFPSRDIWLVADFERHASPRLHVAHELAHVLDNHLAARSLPATLFGGGPADQLVYDLGGNPRGLRFANRVDNLAPALHWKANGGYGNRSSAEYFAETIAWCVYDPGMLPSPVLLEWVETKLFRH